MWCALTVILVVALGGGGDNGYNAYQRLILLARGADVFVHGQVLAQLREGLAVQRPVLRLERRLRRLELVMQARDAHALATATALEMVKIPVPSLCAGGISNFNGRLQRAAIKAAY